MRNKGHKKTAWKKSRKFGNKRAPFSSHHKMV